MPSPAPFYTTLVSSSKTFDEALFRSTLGSPPTTAKYAPALPPKYKAAVPPAPAAQIYLTLETVLEDEEGESLAELEEAPRSSMLSKLERRLYGYSWFVPLSCIIQL